MFDNGAMVNVAPMAPMIRHDNPVAGTYIGLHGQPQLGGQSCDGRLSCLY